MAAKMISDPLTKLQCSPTSDGSGAAVLASEKFVDEHGLVSEPDAPDVDDEHGYARAAARLDAAWVPSTVRSPGSCPNPG